MNNYSAFIIWTGILINIPFTNYKKHLTIMSSYLRLLITKWLKLDQYWENIWKYPKLNNDKKLLNYIFSSAKKHRYHMVTPSPWPFTLSLCLLVFVLIFLNVINKNTSGYFLIFGAFLLITCAGLWFRDVNRESTYMGYHTTKVQTLLRTGFILFLLSEVMVFFGFFWAYFHVSLTPSIFIGNIWPPEGIVLHPFSEDIASSPVTFLGLFDNGFIPSIYESILDCNVPSTIAVRYFFDELYFSNYPMYLELNSTLEYYDILKNSSIEDLTQEIKDELFFADCYDYYGAVIFFLIEEYNLDFNVKDLLQAWRFLNYPSLSTSFSEDTIQYFESLVDKLEDELDFLDRLESAMYMLIDSNYETMDFALECASRDFFKMSCYINIHDSGALVDPSGIPLLNTLLLLTSGCTLMWSHSCLRLRSYLRSIVGLFLTIVLAFIFIFCQFYEYTISAYSIIDGIFGTTFYMLTGLHGFHVIVGTFFLLICLIRMLFMEISSNNHFSYEAAIWYWHFVDVVWIFLYIFVYVWPTYFYFTLIDEITSIKIQGGFVTYNYLYNCPVSYFKYVDDYLYNINFSNYIEDHYIKHRTFVYAAELFTSEEYIHRKAKFNYYKASVDRMLQYLDTQKDMAVNLFNNTSIISNTNKKNKNNNNK